MDLKIEAGCGRARDWPIKPIKWSAAEPGTMEWELTAGPEA
jgi:hypothetical protein